MKKVLPGLPDTFELRSGLQSSRVNMDLWTSLFDDAGDQSNDHAFTDADNYGLFADAGDQIIDHAFTDAVNNGLLADAGDQNNDHVGEEEDNFLERLASLPVVDEYYQPTETTAYNQSNQRNHAWIYVSDSCDVIITGEESFFVHTDALHALSEKLRTIPDDKLDFLWRIANVNLFHGDNSRPMAREIMNIVRAVLVFVGRPDALKDVILELGLFRNDFSMCKCNAGNKRPLGSTMCRSCTGPRKIVHTKRSKK